MKQTVTKTTRIDQYAQINMFGANIYLVTPDDISGNVTESELGFHAFSDGVYPPCTIIAYEKNGGEVMIRSLYQLAVEVFGFDPNSENGKEAIEVFINYLTDVSKQLDLELIEIENALIITSHKIYQMAAGAKISWSELKDKIETDRDLKIATGSMGAATLVSEAIKFGSNVYDKFNFREKISDIVKLLGTMSKVGQDGNVQPLTMSDIENVFDIIKGSLSVSPVNK